MEARSCLITQPAAAPGSSQPTTLCGLHPQRHRWAAGRIPGREWGLRNGGRRKLEAQRVRGWQRARRRIFVLEKEIRFGLDQRGLGQKLSIISSKMVCLASLG